MRPLSTAQPERDATRHSALENIAGLLVGTFVISLGLDLLRTGGAVTGGTAGLALLLSYGTGWPFPVLFVAVNAPFFVLAAWVKGWRFTLISAATVVAVSAFAIVHDAGLEVLRLDPVYAVIAGNILCGIGMLILFRHGASVGGFSIVALIAQERWGWRAGYVQLAFDLAVVAGSLAVIAPWISGLSALGAVVLNLIIAMNHRPERYVGH